jgi:hypothetical protein
MSTINAKELRINLSTIIPGQTTISFNRQMLYNPENTTSSSNSLSSKPFFTDQVKYPIDKISASYSSIIDFFFNVDIFDSILSEELKKGEVHDKNDIIDHNIMAMLFLLFPTRYPVINDVKNSFDTFRGFDPLKTLFFNPLNRAPFSYLKIGSETYTVQKVIWLNDFLNHPRYRQFLFNPRYVLPNITSSNDEFNKFKSSMSQQDIREIIKHCYTGGCQEPKKKIYVGVDMNIPEITIMIDFIKGEVNNSNINSIYCSLFGEITGNRLEELFTSVSSKKEKSDLNSYKVDKNRYMFSIKEGRTNSVKSKDNEVVSEADAKQAEQEDNEYLKIDITVRENFHQIYEKIDKDKMKKILNECISSNITEKRILLFAKKYDDSFDIFKILYNLHFNDNQKNKTKITSVLRNISQYNNDMKQTIIRKRFQISDDELKKLKNNICYLNILELLFTTQIKEYGALGGTTRKTKSNRKQKRRLKQKKYSRKTPH